MTVVKKLAFGGCSLNLIPRYSIVGHAHRDHIPRNANITVVGPVQLQRNYIYIHYDDFVHLHLSDTKVVVYVCGRRFLRSVSIEKKLHTNPILIRDVKRDEIILYVDDINVDDEEPVKKIIDFLLRAYRSSFTTVLLPVYNGNSAHGAKRHKDLHDISMRLINYAISRGLKTYALAHPVIPNDLPPQAIPIPKILETLED